MQRCRCAPWGARWLGTYASAISDLEGAANDHEQRLTSIQASVSQLQGKVELLTNKCDELEGRSRLNNIRIVGVVEGTEGPRPTEFVVDFLHNLLRLDRAHRTLRPRPGDGAPPRPFVVRVNQFQTRNEIIRKAPSLRITLPNGQLRMFDSPDLAMDFVKKNLKTMVDPQSA
uniref:Uncharacterized protein n=1 Tax=Knipowitschia caucasica TaxID=637954 RepID=A0AAV2KJT5_KNICA